jgi:hypothetical protein
LGFRNLQEKLEKNNLNGWAVSKAFYAKKQVDAQQVLFNGMKIIITP